MREPIYSVCHNGSGNRLPISQLGLSLLRKSKFPCMKLKDFFNLPSLKCFLYFYQLSCFLLPQAKYSFLKTDSYVFSFDSISHPSPNSCSVNHCFLSTAFFLLATSLPVFPLTEKKFIPNSHTLKLIFYLFHSLL